MAGAGDVGSVIEHGGLMAYYQPHPVVTTLNPPIHLEPVDWMKTLGAAAQEAGKQISTSPLNPMVRAQMQAETQRAQLEQSQLEFAKNNDWTRNLMSWGPNGLSMVSPISSGQGAWLGAWPFNSKQQPPEAPNGPAYESDYVAAKKAQAEKDAQAEAAAKQSGETKDLSETNVNQGDNSFGAQNNNTSGDVSQWLKTEYGLTQNPNLGMHQGGLVRGYADGGPVKAPSAPGNDQVPQAPPVQQAPAADQPMPPTTPVYNPFSSMVTQPGDPLTSQAQLQQWQASNQSGLHPVIPSAAVKEYLQKNWDTRVKDVTYNPAGGPGGSPTYTAHQKDGGSTTIPLGQLVKNAPHLVMGNNTSFAMSAAEQNPGTDQNGQPAQPAGPPPAQPQPTPQPTPTPGAPPPAPNPQQDLQNAQIQAQVAAQTQNPQNLVAATDQNGNVPQGPNATSNIEFSNPSNVPDSYRNGSATHTAGIPPGADSLLSQIRQQNGAHDQAKDWDQQPDGPAGLNLKVAGVTTGLSGEKVIWYRDMTPDPKTGQPLSTIPFYIISRNAHNTERVYADGAWTHSHVDDPDINLDTEVQARTGQDSRNWNHDQKVWAILNDYNLKNKPMLGQDVQDKLQALTTQAQSAQDISDAINELGGPNANYMNWEQHVGPFLEGMREHARDLDGVPYLGQLWHSALQNWSGAAGKPGDIPNSSVVKLLKGYTAMMGDPGSAALTPAEQAERNTVQLSRTLPTDVAKYFANTKERLKNYITTAVYQGQKVPQVWMKMLGTMANTGRVPSQIIDDKTFNAIYNSPPASLKGKTTPTPGPPPAPGVRSPNQVAAQSAPTPGATPIDVRGMGEGWRAALRGKPAGTTFIDDTGQHTLKAPIQ